MSAPADRLGVGFPATTPLLLARYARVRTGEKLTTTFAATGQTHTRTMGFAYTEPERA